MLQNKNISDFRFFNPKISWGGYPSINTRFTFVSHTLYIHNLEEILHNIFNDFVYENSFIVWGFFHHVGAKNVSDFGFSD